MDQPRIIIVGGGPAGTRCAETLVKAGLRPTLVDENATTGGQIYRRQPDNFTRSYSHLYGTEADKAEAVHVDFDAIRGDIDYRPETVAWAVANDTLFAVERGCSIELPFDALVLCTGATERIVPTPGWNFAGAYSLGGAQVALKSQACSIGKKVAFMGTGPLLYLVASQYIEAGANVVAVLDTSTLKDGFFAMPQLLAMPSMLWRGMGLIRTITAAGVPVTRGARPIEISATADDGVNGLKYRDRRGRVHDLECDAVAMGYHLRSESQLADIAEREFTFDSHMRQWIIDMDADFRCGENIYAAGDGARICGADAAEAGGRLAAMTVLEDMRFEVDRESIRRLHRKVTRLNRFAKGLARAFPWPVNQIVELPDDGIVCRCESITIGELRDVAAAKSADEINRAKAFSRVGMGRCQGRFCSMAAAEIVADAAKITVEQVGRMRGQAPAKPLPITILQNEP